MPKSRDDFPKPVNDAIARRAAFICSNPDCRTLTVAPSAALDSAFLYVGKAAHICAAAEGGPRYDPAMTPEERKSASNGIFLCSNCADMIDKNKGIDFPENILREWKRLHEEWVAANLNKRPFDPTSAATFDVTSVSQQGGITAGIVNIAHQPPQLNASARAAQDFLHLCRECSRQLQRGFEWDDFNIHIEYLLEEFGALIEALGVKHPPLVLEKRKQDGARIAYLYWPFRTSLGGRREKAVLIPRQGYTQNCTMNFRIYSFQKVVELFSAWEREIERKIARGDFSESK